MKKEMHYPKIIKGVFAFSLVFLVSLIFPSIHAVAAPPSSLEDVNSFMFAQSVNDARSRRLIEVIQPDLIHRGVFEWVGTSFADRNFVGAANSISELQDKGSFVMGGTSGLYWAPDYESGPATVNQATKDLCTIQDNTGWFARKLDLSKQIALEQLIYKNKKHIDAGCNGIEMDEFMIYGGTYQATKNALSYVYSELKNYAMNEYNRDVYISVNSAVGGQDVPNLNWTDYDGSEPVDYYLRNMPYKLVGTGNSPNDVWSHYDGTYNWIPTLRTLHSNVYPKRFFYWVDFGGPNQYWAPHIQSEWPNFYRISSAYVIASGGFPGNFRSQQNRLDAYEQGIFPIAANISKFMKENKELWHNLTFINPTVNVSRSNIYTGAFAQTGRTILHLVNGNYNNTTQTMDTQNNFTVNINLSVAPTGVWMTTPDKISRDRKTSLSYTYSNGVATISIPFLEIHNVIVIEQGNTYNPVYAPLDVAFPFPAPKQLPVNNTLKVFAVPTEGFDSTFNWYVNGIAGGNSTVGTIDGNGIYTAPAVVPSPNAVTIKAESKLDTTRSNQFTLSIVPQRTLTWTESFANDSTGETNPSQWYIVDGRGDWKIDTDNGAKVLHNYNMSDGVGDFALGEGTLYDAMIISGDQTWEDYSFSTDVKLTDTAQQVYNAGTGTYLGLAFRYKDPMNYYVYKVNMEGKAFLFKVVNGNFTQVGNAVECNFPLVNTYRTYKVDVCENNFRLFVDGILVRDDVDSSITSGAIGVKASLIDAMYKDINVQSTSSFKSADSRIKADTCDDFSYVYEKSANLQIISDYPTYFGGDTGRFCRSSSSMMETWVTYAMSGYNEAKITAWFYEGEPISDFKFYVSSDNISWTEISPRITRTQPVLWYKEVYDLELPVSARYMKIAWQNLNGNFYSPQIGEVVFDDTREVIDNDTCFDFSHVYEKSENLQVISDYPTYFGGDTRRFCRSSSSLMETWITYQVSGYSNAKITAWFNEGEPISDFKFYVSSDNVTWTEITPKITTTQPVLWFKEVYDLVIPVGTEYMRIAWQNLNGYFFSPQLGDVVLSNSNKAAYTDKCDDFSNVHEKSTNLQVISDYPTYFGGDSGRFCRSGSSQMETWVTYSLEGYDSAKVTAWFSDGEPISDFKFYVSGDNANWTEITPQITRTQPVNWYKEVYGLTIPIYSKYMKIAWQNLSGYFYSPQLGEVEFYGNCGTATTEKFDNFNYLALGNWSSGLMIDSTNPICFDGDTGRLSRTGNPDDMAQWVILGQKNLRNAEITTWFWPDEPISHFKYYMSDNGMNWTEVTPNTIVTPTNYWTKVVYKINPVTLGKNLLKIVWQNLNGQTWSPQIGEVKLESQGDNKVINPGFEEDSEIWNLSPQFSVTTEDKFMGVQSLKCSAVGDGGAAIEEVATTTNTNYRLTFYAKSNKVTTVKVLTVGNATIAELPINCENSWTKYTLDFNSGSNYNVRVSLSDTEGTQGTIYFDEIEIR